MSLKQWEINNISRPKANILLPSMLLTLSGLVSFVVVVVQGHGHLFDPPGRSTLWRYPLLYPGAVVNYNDHSLYCGGAGNQFNGVNLGRCGECGDEWSIRRPRPHDEGGLYGKNIIAKTYTSGDVVQFKVNITVSHKGYMEFRLCPKKSSSELVTQECLDKYVLETIWGWKRINVDQGAALYHPLIRLPAGLTCSSCVLQWTYVTASNWGNCGNGTSGCGCGNQETYKNCADITILPVKI